MSSVIEKAAVLFFLVAVIVSLRRTERWLTKASKSPRLSRPSPRGARIPFSGYAYGVALMLMIFGGIYYLRGAP